MTFALTTERRTFRPNGMAGGGPGEADGGDRWVNLGGNGIVNLRYGERLYINTPEGGAWGALPQGRVKGAENGTTNSTANGTGNYKQPPQYWKGNGSVNNFAATQLEG
ncbi:hypothetical protein MMC08_008552 [Hypocenomyce scalaris]|nr:hypothetical protein [Hypocenomyce scalaris]